MLGPTLVSHHPQCRSPRGHSLRKELFIPRHPIFYTSKIKFISLYTAIRVGGGVLEQTPPPQPCKHDGLGMGVGWWGGICQGGPGLPLRACPWLWMAAWRETPYVHTPGGWWLVSRARALSKVPVQGPEEQGCRPGQVGPPNLLHPQFHCSHFLPGPDGSGYGCGSFWNNLASCGDRWWAVPGARNPQAAGQSVGALQSRAKSQMESH